MTFLKTAAAVLALGVAMPALAETKPMMNPMVGGAEMFADKTIVENASASADHTTLVAAVKAAGLAETLAGAGPFTVFAPTNAAFAKVDAAALSDLMKPENKDKLAKILTCHVVGAEVMSPAVGKMIAEGGGKAAIDTLGGCKLTASIRDSDKALLLTDENGTEAVVTIPDVDQSNGVVHVIDTVVMPKM